MISKGTLLNGRYEIQERVGKGGMSSVYRAQDKRLGRQVAIKVLKKELAENGEYAEKFLREARTTAVIASPHVVTTYDISGEEETYRYMVMEYVEGVTLKDYILKKGKLSNEEAVEIARASADGLSDAHKAGVIHRDIKPQNIVVSQDGRVKIIDFGIALPSTGSRDAEDVLGSVHYISPEQAMDGSADRRSDVYSLGATMYEMVTGVPPFEGTDTEAVLDAHRTNALIPPKVHNRKIWQALSDIIVKCLRKDPEERYQTMNDLKADLDRCLKDPNGHFVHFYKSDEKKKESRKNTDIKRKNRKIIVSAAALVLAVGAAVALAASHFLSENTVLPARKNDIEVAGNGGEEMQIVISGEELVPSIIGLSVDEAKTLLNPRKLSIVVAGKEYNDSYSENIIIRQDPEEGSPAEPGKSVVVTVSMGSEVNAAMNAVKGMTVEEAEKKLSSVGLIVAGLKKQFSDDVPEGLVAGCEAGENKVSSGDPEEGIETSGEKSVFILVSAGKDSEGVMMPNLVGLTYAQTLAVLASSGLEAGRVSNVPGDTETKGLVTGQSITPGELTRKGTAIDLELNLNENEVPDAGVPEGPVDNVDEPESLSPDFWYADADVSVQIPGVFGPSSAASFINVAARLRQEVSGATEYTVITEPRPIATGTRIPVDLRNIRGALGVAEGSLEIYNADTDEVLETVTLSFGPRA